MHPRNAFLIGVTAALLVGCGSSDERALLPVRGVVLLDGKPVAKAAVMFHHAAGNTAYGITGADGSFQLTTRDPGDGAPAGAHRITVSLTIQEGGVQQNAKGLEDYARPITPQKLIHVVPTVYNDPRTSPLSVTISKANSRVTVELSSLAR
jgi:hypothetical protein